MQKILSFFSSYLFVMLFAIGIGLFFSDHFKIFADYTIFLLGSIFFFSALGIDVKSLVKYITHPLLLCLVVFLMLFFFPALVYYATLFFYPPFALSFLLLSAMPTGMTAPLLTRVVGGKEELSLLLAVSTSLIAPFSIPFVLSFFIGNSVEVDMWKMFYTLLMVIGLPFFIAYFFRSFASSFSKKIHRKSRGVSIFLLGLLVSGIVAKQASIILSLSLFYIVGTVFALACMFALLHLLGYTMLFWREKKEKIALSVSLTYMNFTLALFLADKFFNESGIIIPIVLAILPWILMLTPFSFFVKRSEKNSLLV
jgi:bile acid:Na+ symporter, BASS family